eukprot:TRINITY_DN862_c0_g2_i1.p1 TRINITY_DN862_c0_g2~~TRINITY_DN862_c0_g2_i1.p1  ORF type:complete len:195 (+),score=41.44 TRINITY_DN862_c0_g2_i1:52-636(+)
MKNLALIAVFLVCTMAQIPYHAEFDGGNYVLDWAITNQPQATVNITITLALEGWIGIGLHYFNATGSDDHDMYDVDFYVTTFSNGVPTTSDRFTSSSNMGYSAPVTDESIGGRNNVLSVAGSQKNQLSVVSFSRYFVTGDTIGDHDIVDGYMHIIWAHGDPGSANPNNFAYHGESRGHYLVNWVSGDSKPCTTC